MNKSLSQLETPCPAHNSSFLLSSLCLCVTVVNPEPLDRARCDPPHSNRRPINPDDLNVILATDCGSTTTKAILIEKVDGVYRQTHRGEAPTTVEQPVADVTAGVINAATEVGELAGRRLVDENGLLIRPALGKDGCDIYISTSSAGGGLQILVTGVVREMSAASAERASLGPGRSSST